jgi:cyanate permease
MDRTDLTLISLAEFYVAGIFGALDYLWTRNGKFSTWQFLISIGWPLLIPQKLAVWAISVTDTDEASTNTTDKKETKR